MRNALLRSAGRCIVAGLALTACGQASMGIWMSPPPAAPPEPPVPLPFEADAAPELRPTEVPGLRAAPELDPTLYYSASRERWYRWAFNRWYLAFAWDGHWFPLAEPPPELERVTPPPQ